MFVCRSHQLMRVIGGIFNHLLWENNPESKAQTAAVALAIAGYSYLYSTYV